MSWKTNALHSICQLLKKRHASMRIGNDTRWSNATSAPVRVSRQCVDAAHGAKGQESSES